MLYKKVSKIFFFLLLVYSINAIEKKSLESSRSQVEKVDGGVVNKDSNIVTITVPLPVVQNQLTQAILKGSLDEVKKAINEGADINYVDSDGKTPVWFALLLEDWDIVNELLELGAKYDVVYRGNTYVQVVIDKALNKNDSRIDKCLTLLFLDGVHIPYASKFSFNVDVLRMLRQIMILEKRQELASRKYGMVHKLWNVGDWYLYQNKDMIEFCLKHGVDINQNINNFKLNVFSHSKFHPMPALFIAIKWGTKEAIENLLDAGANINLLANPDGKGMQTPLDWALSNGSSNAIRILMQHNAKTLKELQFSNKNEAQ